MTGGLTLSLKPHERFLVGGCLVENGPKRSSVRVVDDNIFVLRLSDALHPDEVRTPVTRAYHVAQMILACEAKEEDVRDDLLERLRVLCEIFVRTPAADSISLALEAGYSRRYHGVLTHLKRLRPLEADMLAGRARLEPGAAESKTAAIAR